MATFKCKMCGGALEIQEGLTVIECEYCGTRQTLPKLNDEKRANLYDRANHFRRNNEFDKASAIYEQVLTEDNTDAEAYWSLVLCRYGIEYVEDPSTHKRLPTVNRAQYTSIFDDDNYKSALKYADINQKAIYESEAKAINKIQKEFLAISQKEEPFDVFICYKETDNNGKRTKDSVLANDLYHQLTQEGFKVFFARITLENKLGSAYEPYIFAALNSAKVMVVLGTKPKFFNAAWVKNEWNRYLSLIKNGAKKVLIPAYKDMDPYDLPEEFSHLQAQDMSKLGFMQDLIRGIKKIAQTDEPKTTVIKEKVVTSNNSTVEPLLKRVFMFLEDGDWKSADEYCEKVLDIDPENAMAYLGKLMAELHVKKQTSLKNQNWLFDNSVNYKKTIRFADAILKETIIGYDENVRFKIYNNAKSKMANAKTENDFKTVASIFKNILAYKDSKELEAECCEKAEVARKDTILSDAKSKMGNSNTTSYRAAIKLLEKIKGWRDADEQIEICKRRIKEIKDKEEEEKNVSNDTVLTKAKSKMKDGDTSNNETSKAKYKEAIKLFQSIKGWKDADEQTVICQRKIEEIKKKQESDRKDDILSKAKSKMEEAASPKNFNTISQYEEAIKLFQSIKGWKDADEQIIICERKIKKREADDKFASNIAVCGIAGFFVLIVVLLSFACGC